MCVCVCRDLRSNRAMMCVSQRYVGGPLCDQCAVGAFDNAVQHVDGCLQCVCMGITTNCGSSSWRYTAVNVPVTNVNGGSTLTVASETETLVQDINMTQINGFTAAQIVLGENSDVYWSHSDAFRGNLLGLYEGSVGFTVRYTTDDLGAAPLTAKLIIMGRGGSKFYFNASIVDLDVLTDITVDISMENMLLAETGVNTTRADLLLGLTAVEMILIPASFYPRIHKS